MFGFEIIAAGATALAGIIALKISLTNLLRRKKDDYYTLHLKNKRFDVSAKTSAEDLQKLIEILKQKENVDMELIKKKPQKERGFVVSEFCRWS